jgi:hypothetical protein
MVENRNELMRSLEEERQRQQDIITATKVNQEATMAEITTKVPELAKYLSYDKATGQVSVSEDYETANIDPATREKYDEFIAALLENEQTINDAQDSIDETNETLDEMDKEGRDETSDLYDRVKDALVNQRQQEIDKLQEVNESIQEAQDALVTKMQEQLDEARQARANEKTENDIADKETRLAYLMRDTSGGNAMEIASLQKEIADAKEGYTDSLVDQSLTKLQEANA